MSDIKVVIPARSGSKRLKNKNLLKIKNKSLLQHAVDFSIGIEPDSIIVSTDSDFYFNSLENKNILNFHKRSEFASSDNAKDFDVILEIYKENLLNEDDILVWIRPSSPIRQVKDFKNALNYFSNQIENFKSLRSIQEVDNHPFWMKKINLDNSLVSIMEDKNEITYPNSATLPRYFFPTCEFEITTMNSALSNQSLISFPSTYYITKGKAVDIDNYSDFRYAKYLMEN